LTVPAKTWSLGIVYAVIISMGFAFFLAAGFFATFEGEELVVGLAFA
jgi:hypothetical protein